MQTVIYWGSFLLLPIFLLAVWLSVRGGGPATRLATFILAAVLGLGVWARFIEPYRLLVFETPVELCGSGLPGTIDMAVVADFHRGSFANTPSMQRIVRTVNSLDPDLVLMPGDFTNNLHSARLKDAFAPFAAIEAPVYAVLGNHDVGYPGPDYGDDLIKALEAADITLLNPGEAIFKGEGKYLRLLGYRDYQQATMEGLDMVPPRSAAPMPTIVIEHNPEAITDPRTGRFDLMVAGHTHGGQVFLPGVTCRLTFACDILRYGLASTPSGQLFVTSGVGMTGLPLRFNVPPRVDLLRLQIDRCEKNDTGWMLLPPHGRRIPAEDIGATEISS
ncbi:phosphoesterase [Parvularcula bermudensis HTCC2503]|uniref:Phosphoesterase n=1 Tax=Parvularcula bermudensis (strain ATCC BAA-594 / HTCC2503 / KCTC 12087) TaxID=314260 RepID=E0TG56_PARBH|nr:metallophosphoesterase [Parvularcula bermudensis]ADM10627.1 phosphoesterase [Parvularcula bermudensis HTCC2503]